MIMFGNNLAVRSPIFGMGIAQIWTSVDGGVESYNDLIVASFICGVTERLEPKKRIDFDRLVAAGFPIDEASDDLYSRLLALAG